MTSSSAESVEPYSVGVLVVSDSCSLHPENDTSGVNLKRLIDDECQQFRTSAYAIVADNVSQIKDKLVEWCDQRRLSVILTTGGSGFAPTDLTPEATRQVIEREANCLTNAILFESLKITKFAMLSRAIAGIRGSTIIINLPGSKKGSSEALGVVLPVLKHAVDLLQEAKRSVASDHVLIQSGGGGDSHHGCAHSHNSNNHHHHERRQLTQVTSGDVLARPRKSAYPMISVDEAVRIVLANTRAPSEVEQVDLMSALNRVSASSVCARDALPPFPASIKDGFAVRLSEAQWARVGDTDQQLSDSQPLEFDVIGSRNAGDRHDDALTAAVDELVEGQCVRINTGAPVPASAHAVVQIEDTVSLARNERGEDSRIGVVATSSCAGHQQPTIQIKRGQDIRPVGFDIKLGEEVVKKNSLIKPAQIGICATVGATKLYVYQLPTVGLVSTGNELVSPSEAHLPPGGIRDANKSLLHAAVRSTGIEQIVDAGIARDDMQSVCDVFAKALASADVVISTGGVSMGDKDLVKDVLEKDFGGSIHFARLNMKPGKPTTFATCVYAGRPKLVFCLPGNPVSAIVTFNLIVMPCLRKLMCHSSFHFDEIRVKCEFDADLDPRPEYHRCRLEWPKINLQEDSDSSRFPSAFSTGNQHSSRLLSMNEANCLVKLPGRSAERPMVRKGDILTALLIDKI